MSWKTSKGFVTSKIRIERIEKVESIKGIVTNGAIAKYMSRKDYPMLSGLIEGGFAINIYLKKDALSKSMWIPERYLHDEYVDYDSRTHGEDNENIDRIADAIDNGRGKSYAAALETIEDKEVICFWYNGNWAIVKENMVGNDPYIPVSLATKIIGSQPISGKRKFQNDGYESVSARGIAREMKIEKELFSYWEMKGIKHFMLNTDMKDGPYMYKREDNKVSIIFNMEFKNTTDQRHKQVSISDWVYENYITAIKNGFNLWDTAKGNKGKSYEKGEGEVSNYGFDKINVSVSIENKNDKKKNKVFIVNSFDEALYDKYIATGIEDYRQAPNVNNPPSSWKINDVGEMTMYNFHTHSDDPYESKEYKRAAGHEFGHLIGLGHAYEPNREDGSTTEDTDEVNAEKDIMWFGNEVSFNDMEMVFLAALYNEKQYFNGPNVSEAITMISKNV